MKRTEIFVGEDGGMTGFHRKYLVVTLRKDGSVSLRGKMDSRADLEGFGVSMPSGFVGLRSPEHISEALDNVLYDIGAFSFDGDQENPSVEESLLRLAREWCADCLVEAVQIREGG